VGWLWPKPKQTILQKDGQERGGFGGPFFVFNNSFLALLA
jgi:hypothetical protein